MSVNIHREIKKKIAKVRKVNSARTESYKAGIKEKIRVNLLEKKQTPEQNKGLIQRYYSAKPKELTQIQQALLEATNA